jgi:hypothetical protein
MAAAVTAAADTVSRIRREIAPFGAAVRRRPVRPLELACYVLLHEHD